MHVCADRQCGYRKTISQISNARCPECHKKWKSEGMREINHFSAVVAIEKT